MLERLQTIGQIFGLHDPTTWASSGFLVVSVLFFRLTQRLRPFVVAPAPSARWFDGSPRSHRARSFPKALVWEMEEMGDEGRHMESTSLTDFCYLRCFPLFPPQHLIPDLLDAEIPLKDSSAASHIYLQLKPAGMPCL